MQVGLARIRVLVTSGILISLAVCGAPIAAAQQSAPQWRPAAEQARATELPEASGVAASRITPGRFCSHNDSGEPSLISSDTTVVLIGEGGGRQQPGTFARLPCAATGASAGATTR